MSGAWKITSGASPCFYLVWESISCCLHLRAPDSLALSFQGILHFFLFQGIFHFCLLFCYRNAGITDACYCAHVYVGPEGLKADPWASVADVSPVNHLSSPPLTFFFNHIFWNSNNSYFVFKYMNFNYLPCARVCVHVPVHACKSWRTTEGINLRNAVYIL